MDEKPFHVCWLAMMLFGFSAMLDSGKHDDISFADVKRHVAAGDLIRFLSDRAGWSIDQGLTQNLPNFVAWYHERLASLCNAIDERRKFGLERRGLCLLISYTAELIQQGDDIKLSTPERVYDFADVQDAAPVKERGN